MRHGGYTEVVATDSEGNLVQLGTRRHGFISTGAHGRGGTYCYSTCFARQRHGTARCDQDWIPADSVEDAILGVTAEALSDPSFFEKVAALTRREWEQAHPGRERDLRRVARAIDLKRASTDRYLTASESGKLPEEACGGEGLGEAQAAAGLRR